MTTMLLDITTKNEYRGYNLFNDVGSSAIRAWNRLNTLFNIKEEHGNAIAVGYAQQLSKEDNATILMLANYVTAKGYETTRREIFKEEINGEK